MKTTRLTMAQAVIASDDTIEERPEVVQGFVEAVLRGEPVPAHDGPDEDVQVFPGLSQRESEVLVLIGRGLSNQEIADRIYVSVNSVKTYIRQIYAKTGATRRTQAVAWAHEHGWGG